MALTAGGTVSGYPKNPNATGLTRLTTGLSADDAKSLLKGQVVVASYDSGGARLDATRAQIQSVLDASIRGQRQDADAGRDLQRRRALGQAVGAHGQVGDAAALRHVGPAPRPAAIAMTLDAASGVWSVTGDATWNRQFYLFDVRGLRAERSTRWSTTWSPTRTRSACPPDGAATGDVRSQFVNLADADLKPAGWDSLAKPALAAPEDIVIYEMHIRDFSINDAHGGRRRPRHLPGVHLRRHRAARQHDAVGRHEPSASSCRHAGLTHVHLLPAFDIASVIEPAAPAHRADRAWPRPATAQDQQAAVGAAPRHRWLQLGLRPVPLRRARRLLQHQPGRRDAHPGVPATWCRRSTGTACAW